MPAGYFKARAGNIRSPDQRDRRREGLRPKRRWYAKSEDQDKVMSAFCDQDMDSVEDQCPDGLYA